MANIWIFASGTRNGWWSGLKKLLERVESWEIEWVENIVVVSNHVKWWVYDIVNKYENRQDVLPFNIKFHSVNNFPKRWDNWHFSPHDLELIKQIGAWIMEEYHLDYVFLSWRIKHILWIPTEKLVNIHPGPTQKPYGGVWMYGHHVHNKVWEDYKNWIIKRSCITMHYVTEEVDEWPIICQIPVVLEWCDSAEDVWRKVNQVEHEFQWIITKMIIDWDIYLDKKGIVNYPDDFQYNLELNLKE